MPRSPKSPAARAAEVTDAIAALPDALANVVRATGSAEDSRRAWEQVEMLGATIHRQSRLLAGKPRGG